MTCLGAYRRYFAFLLLLQLCPGLLFSQQPAAPSQTQRPELTQLAPGILSSQPLFATDSLPKYRVEIINLVIGPKQNAPEVPLEGFALMELRSGSIEVTLDGKTSRQEGGAVWLVRKGARLGIRNLGEVAIIRTTVFMPR